MWSGKGRGLKYSPSCPWATHCNRRKWLFYYWPQPLTSLWWSSWISFRIGVLLHSYLHSKPWHALQQVYGLKPHLVSWWIVWDFLLYSLSCCCWITEQMAEVVSPMGTSFHFLVIIKSCSLVDAIDILLAVLSCLNLSCNKVNEGERISWVFRGLECNVPLNIYVKGLKHFMVLG